MESPRVNVGAVERRSPSATHRGRRFLPLFVSGGQREKSRSAARMPTSLPSALTNPVLGWFSVAVGGAVGAVARYGVSMAFDPWLQLFPFGTLVCNVIGSFVIGIGAGVWKQEARKTFYALFLMTGFCGGFTTFSTFSLQTLDLIMKNKWGRAFANMVGSVAVCILFTFFGMLIGDAIREAGS